MDSAAFKSLLETTIANLNSMGTTYGVGRPSPFGYTFADQRTTMQFEATDLLPWTYQLLEIKALCETLYRTRIHSVVALRRARATPRDVEGRFYILPKTRISTNTTINAVVTPYEVVFQGFTSELAGILHSLAKSPQAFLVKNINVQVSDQTAGAESSTGPDYSTWAVPTEAAPPPTSPADLMRQRYGLGPGSRYGGMRPQMPPPVAVTPLVPATAVRRGPETVLDERLLRFILRVDAVRPLIALK
jgi:hypothetical protein